MTLRREMQAAYEKGWRHGYERPRYETHYPMVGKDARWREAAFKLGEFDGRVEWLDLCGRLQQSRVDITAAVVDREVGLVRARKKHTHRNETEMTR